MRIDAVAVLEKHRQPSHRVVVLDHHRSETVAVLQCAIERDSVARYDGLEKVDLRVLHGLEHHGAEFGDPKALARIRQRRDVLLDLLPVSLSDALEEQRVLLPCQQRLAALFELGVPLAPKVLERARQLVVQAREALARQVARVRALVDDALHRRRKVLELHLFAASLLVALSLLASLALALGIGVTLGIDLGLETAALLRDLLTRS